MRRAPYDCVCQPGRDATLWLPYKALLVGTKTPRGYSGTLIHQDSRLGHNTNCVTIPGTLSYGQIRLLRGPWALGKCLICLIREPPLVSVVMNFIWI